jgi:uncharacterized protein (DUF362 family)
MSDQKYKVILRRCDSYDEGAIRKIIHEGMEELGARPQGKVLVKPNGIFAHRRYGRYGCTNSVFLRTLLSELSEKTEIEKITLGERTAVTVPTRYTFQEAGWNSFKKIPKVDFCFFDEASQVKVKLKKGTVHKDLRLARAFVEADYKIYAPKLKHHVSSNLTCSLKLNMGILDSRDRLNGHDYRLEDKIADLYEAGYPDFIVVDGIEAGQQNELVPVPRHVGVIIMGTTGVAVDSVAARIIGFKPEEIRHLSIARSRGWEPASDDQIEITGDVTLEELQERTRDFDRTFHDPRDLDTPIRFYFGNYPKGQEICHTGCINMIKSALAIFEAYDPGALKRARPVAVVIGEYEGDVDGQGYPILLVGTCTKVLGKTTGTTRRIPGCPVLVPFFVVPGAYYFKLKSPYLDPSALVSFPLLLGWSYLRKALARLGPRRVME